MKNDYVLRPTFFFGSPCISIYIISTAKYIYILYILQVLSVGDLATNLEDSSYSEYPHPVSSGVRPAAALASIILLGLVLAL